MTKKIHTDLEITGSLTVGGQPVNGGSGIPETLIDAKGDMVVGSSADTAAKLAVGSDGQVLTANSVATNGVEWTDFWPTGPPMVATGGVMYDSGLYRYHKFTSDGTFSLAHGITADVLVVAGGGGGGSNGGGGGGSGGTRNLVAESLSGGDHTVIVGMGGSGGAYAGALPVSGENSSMGALIAIGGGAGGNPNTSTSGLAGGSGGGDSRAGGDTSGSGTVGQGYDGGAGNTTTGGGGGGAGGDGGASGVTIGGNGGIGITWDAGTEMLSVGGGGGGGADNDSGAGGTASYGGGSGAGAGQSNGITGTINTGGGGGAGGRNSPYLGGDGGSGIVFVRYLLTDIGEVPYGDHELPVGGSTGQLLAKTSNADFDVEWVTQGGGIQQSLFDAKGDLFVASAADTASRLAAGADGQVLVTDSAEATGLKWVNATSVMDNVPLGATVQTYTPVLTAITTNPTLGTGSSAFGRYWQLGSRVTVEIGIRFGTSGTNAGSGDYYVSLPQNARSSGVDSAGLVRGHGILRDDSAVAYTPITAIQSGNDKVALRPSTGPIVTHTSPWAWTINDGIYISLSFEAETDIGLATVPLAIPNQLHNPALEIWQRGIGSTSCPADIRTFLADRWFVRPSGAAVTQQQSSSIPVGSYARFSLQIDGAASVTTVDVAQRVEAANIPALARTVTFSWRVYNGTGASLTPSLLIGTPAASDVFTTVTNRLTQSLQACSDAAWTTVSHTVDISSYTNLANGMEIALQFPSGSVVAGDIVRITEAQVTATNGVVGFNRPGALQETNECLRYYWFVASGEGQLLGLGGYQTSSIVVLVLTFPVMMRAIPTLEHSSGTDYYLATEPTQVGDTFNSFILDGGSTRLAATLYNTEVSDVAGRYTRIKTNHASAYVALSAEL